ncbi:MAG: hypothetical protein IJ240_03130 [Clostridia bacterium]|nr:hypothetical protein [Clostridia bacterium]
MQEFSVVSAEVLLRARAESLLSPFGVHFGKDTVADCMADETIRPFFGRMLQTELMPLMPKEGRDEAVIAACRYLSFRPTSLRVNDLLDGLIDTFSLYILPDVTAKRKGLVLSLAALILLFAGARRVEGGYSLIGSDGSAVILTRDEEALRSFSRLSCDMQADSLAYAVLSDVAIWNRDLRQEEGLEEALTAAIQDIQLLGLKPAMERAFE